VRLDPKFALAWALLSYGDSVGYIGITLQAAESLREEARQGAETALTLQPNLGEGLVAKGYYYYAYMKDYPSAVRYFEQARLLPNSSRIPESLAYVARRGGQWEQSESFFNQAERLDPRNVNLLSQHALSYILLRRFPEALGKLDQVLNITLTTWIPWLSKHRLRRPKVTCQSAAYSWPSSARSDVRSTPE
jgi:tetratricopeptide (TPR) repeat protein